MRKRATQKRTVRWSRADRDRLILAYRNGNSIAEIASELDRSTSAIHNALYRERRATALPERRSRVWSPGDEGRLAAQAAQGASIDAVSGAVNRSVGATRARLRAMAGTPSVHTALWTDSDDAELRKLYAKGLTFAEIAAQIDRPTGQTAGRVYLLRRTDASMSPRKPRWTDGQRRKLAKLYRDGMSLNELEREFDRTRGTITSQLRTLRKLGYDLTR